MEENQKKICPRCGTELMEDNFCMGCGVYVDPATKKEASDGYGTGSYDASGSFGSFGSSAAAGAGGILGGGVLGTNGVLGNGILGDHDALGSGGSDYQGFSGSGSGNAGDALGSSSGNVLGAADNASGADVQNTSGVDANNPFGVDMASILGGIEPDQSFSGAGAASDANGNSDSPAGNGYGGSGYNGYGGNGYGGNGYGGAGAGYGSNGYGGANAGYGASGSGYGSNGAGRTSSGYAEGTSDKMPLMQSILIMAGIAIAVFLGIFIMDSMTKVKDKVTELHSFDSENSIEGTMSILAAGDKVKQITEEERWNISGYSSEQIEFVKGYVQDYYGSYDAYDFIFWDVKQEGTNLMITVIYRDLDKRANIKSLVKLGIVEDGAGDYVSLKETVKSLKSAGWTDTPWVQIQ